MHRKMFDFIFISYGVISDYFYFCLIIYNRALLRTCKKKKRTQTDRAYTRTDVHTHAHLPPLHVITFANVSIHAQTHKHTHALAGKRLHLPAHVCDAHTREQTHIRKRRSAETFTRLSPCGAILRYTIITNFFLRCHSHRASGGLN